MAEIVDEDLNLVFDRLRGVMLPLVSNLDIKRNDEGDLYVDTFYLMKNKKPLWFGGLRLMKNYVSYHLMPVYVAPALLADISPVLLKRMQGKSCFNFKVVDEGLFREVGKLTERGLEYFRECGYS